MKKLNVSGKIRARNIYRELVLIRKELQNIRGVMESNLKVAVNSKNFTEAVQKAIRDNV